MSSLRLGRRAVGFGLLAAPLAAPFVATRTRAGSGEPLRIRLDWTPWGAHAAIHLASVKGWYRDAGLDVTVDDGNGTNQTVQIVGGGDDVDVGHAALSSMIIARGKGLNLKAIASYVRTSDIGVMIPVDSPIRAIKDLRGKRVGYTASSLETPFLGLFLKAGGLTRDDVELVNLDGATKLAAYLTGKLDGAFSSIPFFVPVVETQRKSRAIMLADAGLRMPSYGLFARDSDIKAKQAALTRFASVTDGAWAYVAAGHQEESVAAIHTARPNAKLNAAAMLGQVNSFISFFKTDATKDAPVGKMAPVDWTDAMKTLASADLIPKGLAATDCYSNDLFDSSLYARTVGTKA
ncbi:ABC transporter substrate-binding protein [Acidisphaera sp. S103]|uniref:ABC transporter substrate-binding protein n=1 Tax=Acidisphaera sp. S103 TaxID=1747223 RepID=UPI00131B192D|nr:ABC transporter substrate-binding protein [Acidisphaera sp. S103]